MRITRKTKQFGIFIVDFALLYAAMYLSLMFRAFAVPSLPRLLEHVVSFLPVMPLWLITFYTMGLYVLETPFDDVNFIGRLAASVAVATLVTALYFYLGISRTIAPKSILLINSIFAFALILGWRYLLGKALRSSIYKKVTLFIGLTDEAESLIREIGAKPFLGYEVAFVYDEKAAAAPDGILLIREPDELGAALLRCDPDLVVISEEKHLQESMLNFIFGLLKRRVRYESLSAFYENLFRRVPIGAINETWFLANIEHRENRPYEIVKRILDIGISSLILLFSLPFWPLIALGIKCSSPGPVFFKQSRLGRGGVPFTILKFRTMRVDGNNFMPTGKNDPRVVAFGKFLRTTRLDELPQSLNILHGEMSFVGPRPERPELAEKLERAVPFYRQRLLVKPGLTGWDQVSGEYHSPSVEDTFKKLQYDLYYIKNMSPSLDASIFFKTIMTVVGRIGR
jgi:exopolysaccharide biosynthesis polyprenyl glycosylphosphotransferase